MTELYTQPLLKSLAQQYRDRGQTATAEILEKLAIRRGPKPKKLTPEQQDNVCVYDPPVSDDWINLLPNAEPVRAELED